MKKRTKKLVLAKDTLRTLEGERLSRPAGGGPATYEDCTETCGIRCGGPQWQCGASDSCGSGSVWTAC